MDAVAYHLQPLAGVRINDGVPVGVLQPFRAPSPFQVLAPRAGISEADTPWEPVETFRAAHPCFQLEDELFVDGGRSVMYGNDYLRTKHSSG